MKSKIEDFHNIHRDESCIIIGNGPSLRDVPFDFLNKNITFGTNKIFLFKGFTPNYYVSVNPLVIVQSWHEIITMKAPVFISEVFAEKDMPETYYLHSMRPPLFSYDPSRYVYEGHTVTFVCLQLAFFMGFTKVGLVGVDHRFIYEGEPNEEKVMEGDDPNHFDPNYFKGQRWNNPDLARSEEAYKMALEAFESVGRKIVNLTLNSALEVFPKQRISKWRP